MNKSIIYVDTIKFFSENYFLTKKGETTDKNRFFASLLDKIADKNIGCMIEVDTFFRNNRKMFANYSDCGFSMGQSLSSFINEKEIINFFNVINLFLEERCIYCYKYNGRFYAQVFNKKVLLKTLFVAEKNHSVQSSIKIYDPFTECEIDEKTETKKGKRLFTVEDEKTIKNSLPSGLIDAINTYNAEYKKNQSTTETKKEKKTVSA